MAIFFVGEGRLGNQIFQYAAIRAMIGTGPLWTSGLGALEQVFDLPPGFNRAFGTRFVESVIRKLLVPMVIRPLFKQFRLGQYCFEPVERLANGATGMSGRAMRVSGLLESTFVDGGYYQNLSDLLSRFACGSAAHRRATTLIGLICSVLGATSSLPSLPVNVAPAMFTLATAVASYTLLSAVMPLTLMLAGVIVALVVAEEFSRL